MAKRYDSSSNNPYSYYSRSVRTHNAKLNREEKKNRVPRSEREGGNYQRDDYDASDYTDY